MIDTSSFVSARRHRVDGLLDVVLEPADDGGLARPGGDGTSLSARELATLIRVSGGEDLDIRVLMPDGGHFLGLLGATAKELGRDILAVPAGADPRRMPSPDGLTGDPDVDDVVPVDRASGLPVDWLVVQPADRATSLPGWFDLVSGLVLPRTGLVTMPLPGGLGLATRTDFVARRAATARLGSGHHGLVTVAVGIRDGQFVVGDYDATSQSQDGTTFAAALSMLPLYGCDLRLWISWPDTVDAQRRLTSNLHALAETTGAVVWAPPLGGRAEIIDGCRDLGALDDSGAVGNWKSYQPPPRSAPRFSTDADGRLVPFGGFVIERFPGVPLVSVAPARVSEMASRYERLRARAGTFVADLAVLDDGRLAARTTDATLMAVGPRQLAVMLAEAGWRGTNIALLCEVSPERVPGLRRCVAVLSSALACDISVVTPGAVSRTDDRPAPTRPVSDVVTSGHPLPAVSQLLSVLDPEDSADAARLTELSVMVAEYLVVENRIVLSARPDDRDIETRARLRKAIEDTVGPALRRRPPPPAPDLTTVDTDGAEPIGRTVRSGEGWAPTPTPGEPTTRSVSPFVERPVLVGAQRGPVEHGIRWLPELPQVNAETLDLYVFSSSEPERAVADGIPGAELFLLARLDPRRLAGQRPGGFLIQVRVQPGGAVDVAASAARAPSELQHVLIGTDVFLLPAAFLDRTQALVGYVVESDGVPRELAPLPSVPLSILSGDARHGAVGLPNDVDRWPKSRLRAGARAYGFIPDGSPDWIELTRRKPRVRDGFRLVELEIGEGRAINVEATFQRLAPLTAVRTRLPELHERGIELILPRRSYGRVTMMHAYEPDGTSWRRLPAGAVTLGDSQAAVRTSE